MLLPVFNKRDARVGHERRGLVATVNRYLTDRSKRAGVEPLVDVGLKIQELVPQHIGARAGDTLGKTAVNQSRSHRCWRQRRAVVGESPYRCRVPRILHRRAVVDRYAPEHVVVKQLALARMADVDIAELGLLTYAVEHKLDEAAHFWRNSSRPIQRCLIKSHIIVWPKTRRRSVRLWGRRVGEGRLCGKRQWQSMVLAVAGHIAVQLEVAPKWRQLR